MATKEIIEVGSSDEEAEPPPKKRKPVLNAMVHIPSRLPGISIKPAKKSSSNTLENIPNKVYISKNITQKATISNVTAKCNILINPLVNKLKNNSVTIKKAGNTVVFLKDPLTANQQAVKKAPNIVNNTHNFNRNVQIFKKVQSPGPKRAGPSVLSNLPSSITVKKAPLKSIIVPTSHVVVKKKVKNKSKPIPPINEIPTVDLDDEEAGEEHPPTSNMQWYMTPEDSQKEVQNIEDENSEDVNFEEQNNKEPETPKYVEITIEDSPIKPADRHLNEIGKELPVIIDDSPCKNKSDDEETNHGRRKADPQSRKKLYYPQIQSVRQVVEIEYDPLDAANVTENKDNITEEHPTTSIEPDQTKPEEQSETKLENVSENKKEPEQEFHPLYHKFIETCFGVENSDDMKKIVEKKIKAYYRQCPKEYVESEEFLDMVASKTESIKAGPDKMYLYIKDVVDELNMQRKLVKQEANKEVVPTVPEESFTTIQEDGEYDSKRLKQIRKLEKTIKQLHRAIQKLEEQEVDLDDEENSMYLLTERYKERLVRVHAKFRQMTNTKMPSEPRIVIEARPGCPQGAAKKLEKFINKKVPIGTPLPFPDFHDVLRCVREANDEDALGWSNMEVEAEARDLFERCGKKLKRRRQENEWRISVSSRMPTDYQDKDPAEDNVELKKKLSENKLIAAKRESEILNKYADRQYQLKLEAEEIGDKEAEESGGESDEEEAAESHLADKEKRKEILKKLIKEKNRTELSKNEQKTIKTPDKNSSENSNTAAQNDDADIADANKEDLDSETQKLQPKSVDDDNVISNDNKETESSVIDIDSDADELHLLQRLRFEDEIITSSSDSDSDTTVAISDSLESENDDENDKIVCSDIISIEDSSYSESESLLEEVDGLSNVAIEINSNDIQAPAAKNLENATLASNEISKKTNINISEENIFLASSENDDTSDKNVTLGRSKTCTNLKDDVLCLTDTILGDEDVDYNTDVGKNTTDENDVTLGESETYTNLKDADLSITDNVLEGEDVDHSKDADQVSEVNENETLVKDKDITEEIESINGDCIEPKDVSKQVHLNDTARNEFDIDKNSKENRNAAKIEINDGLDKT